jgi:protein SCO1
VRATLAALTLAAGIAFASPALSRLSQADLDEARAVPPPGATLPLAAAFRDVEGRASTLGEALSAPAEVVAFVDYRCPDLCSPIVALTSAALRDSGLRPGKDYRLVLIGFNPQANADDARRMVEDQVDPAVRDATSALVGDPSAVQTAATAAGYRFVYDPERQRYAHPIALFVVNREGRIMRELSGLAATPRTLRLALVDASSGAVGGLGDVIALHCYGFDASVGFYADRIRMLLWAACGLTLLAGAAAMLRLVTRPAQGSAP